MNNDYHLRKKKNMYENLVCILPSKLIEIRTREITFKERSYFWADKRKNRISTSISHIKREKL